MTPPCSPNEAARRLDVVLKLFVTGEWSNAHAHRLAAEWGVTERTVRDYSRMAAKLLAPLDRESLEELRADTIVKLGLLHDDARTVGEFRSAVAALAERAKVAGLVGSGVTINNTVIQSLTVDQVREAPATRELLDTLADTWRAVDAELLRFARYGGDFGRVLAAANAHRAAIVGERDVVDVEALPEGGGEDGDNA